MDLFEIVPELRSHFEPGAPKSPMIKPLLVFFILVGLVAGTFAVFQLKPRPQTPKAAKTLRE